MKLSTDYDVEYDELEPEEEDGKPVKPATGFLVFLGLVVVSAVICAILWNVTHSDRGEGNTDKSLVKQTEEPGADGGQLPDSGREPGNEVPSGESGKPDSGTVPGESDGGNTGATSGEDNGGNTGTVPGGDGGANTGAALGEGNGGNTGTAPGRDDGAASGSGSGANSGATPGEGNGGNTGPAPGRDDGAESGSGSGANPGTTPEGSGAAGQGTMTFADCEDTVTPKEVINLRSTPSTAQTDNIVTQARNGELLARTGMNSDTGWSRVEYNGQTLYAVSGYLTADLAYQPPAAITDGNSVSTRDGRTIVFTDCDDTVSPKIYVNLRLEPSTSEGNDTVHCRLDYGMNVHRTGISEDSGWSRVEYDGLVLYVVTSYIYVVEEDSQ